jgi:hypothetical protein
VQTVVRHAVDFSSVAIERDTEMSTLSSVPRGHDVRDAIVDEGSASGR